jgi:hypothetical protein
MKYIQRVRKLTIAEKFKTTAVLFALTLFSVLTLSVNEISAQQKNLVIDRKPTEYDEINIKFSLRTMDILRKGTENQKTETIKRIIASSENYIPPVFFVLAGVLYEQGKKEEAIFWLNAGRLRGQYDVNRCADKDAGESVYLMTLQVPRKLIGEQYEDQKLLREIVQKVIKWDETTLYHYDHRWPNLHTMTAYSLNLVKDIKVKPLSLPKEQWPKIAKETRENFIINMEKNIEEFTRQSQYKDLDE